VYFCHSRFAGLGVEPAIQSRTPGAAGGAEDDLVLTASGADVIGASGVSANADPTDFA
jgi:hypothetical protein